MKSTLKTTFGLCRHDAVFMLILAAGALFLFVRAPIGFGNFDESGYIDFAYRVAEGNDSPIVDEWHLAQLMTFFLYLPVKLYFAVVGSTSGIILAMRYLFIVTNTAVAAAIYRFLRSRGYVAIACAMIYFFHIPFTIMALSYSSIGIACVELIGLILLTAEKPGGLRFFACGIIFAFAVLCNPYFTALYFIFTLLAGIYALSRRKSGKLSRRLPEFLFAGKTWLSVTLGVAVVTAIFAVFVFSRTTLGEILENLPMLFDDPEYSFDSSENQNIFHPFKTLSELIGVNKWLFAADVALTAAALLDRGRLKRRKYYVMAATAVFAAYTVPILFATPYTSSTILMFLYVDRWVLPFFLFGTISYILTEKKDRRVFGRLWVTGMVYAVFMDISSDMGFKAFTFGLSVANTANAIFIARLASELADERREQPDEKLGAVKKIACVLLVASLVLQPALELSVIALAGGKNARWESAMIARYDEPASVKIPHGALKGVITSPSMAEFYLNTYDDISVIRSRGQGNLLNISGSASTWVYLDAEMPFATFQTLLYPYNNMWIDDTYYIDRLEKYYELHPDKLPRYIYGLYSIFGQRQEEFDAALLSAKERFEELVDEYGCTYTLSKGKAGYIIELFYQ